MRKKIVYLATIAAVAVLAVIGAFMTPMPVSAVANPYLVGGQLEVPQQNTSPNYTGLAVGITVAALAVGALIAWKMKEG